MQFNNNFLQIDYMAAALLIENFYSSFQMYLQDLGVECGGHPKEFQLPFVVRITLKIR